MGKYVDITSIEGWEDVDRFPDKESSLCIQTKSSRALHTKKKKVCLWCGEEFDYVHANQKYCNSQCFKDMAWDKTKKRLARSEQLGKD